MKPRPAILLVDDDADTCEAFGVALGRFGLDVSMANSGREALTRVAASSFDLVVVDQVLGDMLGTDLVRQWQSTGLSLPFVVVSGFLTTPETVDAMRLGAIEAVDKPLDQERFEAVVLSALQSADDVDPQQETPLRSTEPPIGAWGIPPRSTAERWAMLMLEACQADSDFRSLDGLARAAATSTTVFTNCCRVLEIRPHDARDLARMLRALRLTRFMRAGIEAQMLVGDPRTLRCLIDRAGLDAVSGVTISFDEFLDRQRFVDRGNDGLKALRAILVQAQPR
jgi:DNA-binding response OmpR family regulator